MKKGQSIGSYQDIETNAYEVVSFNISKKNHDKLKKMAHDAERSKSYIVNKALNKL
jgi:predicted transcriptional regulator